MGRFGRKITLAGNDDEKKSWDAPEARYQELMTTCWSLRRQVDDLTDPRKRALSRAVAGKITCVCSIRRRQMLRQLAADLLFLSTKFFGYSDCATACRHAGPRGASDDTPGRHCPRFHARCVDQLQQTGGWPSQLTPGYRTTG